MIRLYRPAPDGAGLQMQEGLAPALDDAVVWIDLLSPEPGEKVRLEALLGFAIPSLEEMREVEISSRLFTASGAAFMTASVPAHRRDGGLREGPVTFILKDQRLITIRYHQPRAFEAIARRIIRLGLECDSGAAMVVALLELIVDDLADMLEDVGKKIESLSWMVFKEDPPGASGGGLQSVLRGIGASDDALSKAADSLSNLTRLMGFFSQHLEAEGLEGQFRRRNATIERDLRSLGEHSSFLSGKIAFQLDATLGMINIEQNNIIKIFSVMSVIFLPPTLIASLYGMNFRFMPELSWPWGYPSRWGRWWCRPFCPISISAIAAGCSGGAVAVVVAAAFVARKSFETSQIRLGLAPVLVYIGRQGVTGREKHEP